MSVRAPALSFCSVSAQCRWQTRCQCTGPLAWLGRWRQTTAHTATSAVVILREVLTNNLSGADVDGMEEKSTYETFSSGYVWRTQECRRCCRP